MRRLPDSRGASRRESDRSTLGNAHAAAKTRPRTIAPQVRRLASLPGPVPRRSESSPLARRSTLGRLSPFRLSPGRRALFRALLLRALGIPPRLQAGTGLLLDRRYVDAESGEERLLRRLHGRVVAIPAADKNEIGNQGEPKLSPQPSDDLRDFGRLAPLVHAVSRALSLPSSDGADRLERGIELPLAIDGNGGS